MRLLLICLFVCFTNRAYSQSSKVDDRLLAVICRSIDTSQLQNDSLRVMQAFEHHLFPLLREIDSTSAQNVWTNVFFRLQHNCVVFKEILDRQNPQKGDWKKVDGKPESQLEKNECSRFKQITAFSYLERSGDTVHVSLVNGYWVDHFKDGTHSKLKLKWVNDCRFVIEFIDSNNLIRQNFSKAGDQYSYEILNKGSGYYDMSVTIPGTDQYSTFKLYY